MQAMGVGPNSPLIIVQSRFLAENYAKTLPAAKK
jgi:hypothetical protein